MKCFVDTGALAALFNKNDPYHKPAKTVWASLKERNAILYTTRDVVIETVILVRRRASHALAVACGQRLWQNPVIDVLRPDPSHDRAAWDIFQKHVDKELSFVDCLSFVFMKELRLRHAFTFDKNFTQLGFEAVSGDSLSISPSN
jgi:predicted nucleic acid-binding protein